MIVPLLLFVIAIVLVAIFWELSKINNHLKQMRRCYQDPFLGKTHGDDTDEENESPQAEDVKITRKLRKARP